MGAIMKYIIKDEKLIAISLFFILHGIKIIEDSFDMINNMNNPNILWGVNINEYSGLAFVVGLILILNAVGLLAGKKIFYISSMIISLISIIYSASWIIYLLFSGLSVELLVFFILSIYLVIYVAIFKYIKSQN